MAIEIFSQEVTDVITGLQKAAQQSLTKTVTIDGQAQSVPYPFPSPGDWRDGWIYFLLTDRFDNPLSDPKFPWDQKFGFRQGGTFAGIKKQLGYIQQLGAKAIWLSPVLKNSKPSEFAFTYPGYNTQDFLNIDERFGSDGTLATAERELQELVEEAHARGLYVIQDIVINHAARIFDYVYHGTVTDNFTDSGIMNGPLGDEPPIQWLNGLGFPRGDWQNTLPDPNTLSPDDAVWPIDLQRTEFFRRRGTKLSDAPSAAGFAAGDFGVLRQLVAEYDAQAPGQDFLRQKYGPFPVLSILVRCYEYLIAKYDLDGFRIDTVKYVKPSIVETFGNAMREYALSVGKTNFFTFGEVYDDEATINHFIGRNSGDVDGFGIDAALDYPLFFQLPNTVKGFGPVESVRHVFENRKRVEQGIVSSHGDAGRYFVTFLDNHDQNARFNAPGVPIQQVLMGTAILLSLQGVPCLYYGTEQGLVGTNDGHGNPTLDSNESVREALWGKEPPAFDQTTQYFKNIAAISRVRLSEAALRYGRIYFRELSGNGTDFGQSTGVGGVIAFSRILTDREILIVANTSFGQRYQGECLVDLDLSRRNRTFSVAYSNVGTTSTRLVTVKQANVFAEDGSSQLANIASLSLDLAPMEVQILLPS